MITRQDERSAMRTMLLSIAVGSGVFAGSMAGCASKSREQLSAEPTRERRATASDLVSAARSGSIPDWFSEAERKAVRRLME